MFIIWLLNQFKDNIMNGENIITVMVNWDDVRQDVDINLYDFVNLNNDLEACGDLTDAYILAFITMCSIHLMKYNTNVLNSPFPTFVVMDFFVTR